MIEKIPFVIVSTALGTLCFFRTWVTSYFAFIPAAVLLTGIVFYTSFVLRGNTKIFHKYVGNAWCIMPTLMAAFFFVDGGTSWDRIKLMLISLCMGIVVLWVWRKDPLNEKNTFFEGIGVIVLPAALAGSVMMINESVVKSLNYIEVQIAEKLIFENTHSWTDDISYSIKIQSKGYFYDGMEFDVPEEFFYSLEETDSVRIGVCTGLLGGQFCFLDEDVGARWDFYGLN